MYSLAISVEQSQPPSFKYTKGLHSYINLPVMEWSTCQTSLIGSRGVYGIESFALLRCAWCIQIGSCCSQYGELCGGGYTWRRTQGNHGCLDQGHRSVSSRLGCNTSGCNQSRRGCQEQTNPESFWSHLAMARDMSAQSKGMHYKVK